MRFYRYLRRRPCAKPSSQNKQKGELQITFQLPLPSSRLPIDNEDEQLRVDSLFRLPLPIGLAPIASKGRLKRVFN